MSAPTPPPATAAHHLRAATARLTAAGIDGAGADARRLLAHALGIAPDRVTLTLGDAMSDAQAAAFDALIAARAARTPVSHLTGRRAFWGRDFAVTPDVLDPRPETETLIAAALGEPFAAVLDLGTGSGAILLTLLAERGDATGTGTDISPAALAIARANAAALGVVDRATFRLSDWCTDVTGTFDLIVSNPPYIAAAELPSLAPEVRDHEPHVALTDGADGLTAYPAILAQTGAHLVPGGRLLLEIGWQQAATVSALARAAGYGDVRVLPDLDGRDRVVALRRGSRS